MHLPRGLVPLASACLVLLLAAAAQASGTEPDLFTRALEKGPLYAAGAAVLGGLAVSLTPCVYPLISVTIAYFGRQAAGRGRLTLLAAVYVVGIALSFSALGVGAALSGGLFGAALQKPAVVLFIAAVMITLALSSFGLYQLQPPAAIRTLLFVLEVKLQT